MSYLAPTAPEIYGAAYTGLFRPDRRWECVNLGSADNELLIYVKRHEDSPWRTVGLGSVTFSMRSDPSPGNALYLMRYAWAMARLPDGIPKCGNRMLNAMLEEKFQAARQRVTDHGNVYTVLFTIPGRTPDETAADVLALLRRVPEIPKHNLDFDLGTALWPLPEHEIVALVLTGALSNDAVDAWREARRRHGM